MIDLGLQRISRLMAGSPMPWRAIHVAGTNGKGSVCHYISEMLNVWNKSRLQKTEGKPALSHGRFTSPHLLDPWDCISLSNESYRMEPLSSREFHNIMDEVAERNRKMDIKATDFELLTATAFEAFTRAKVEVAVVEVGMGGRLDSTNIIGQPVQIENRTKEDVDVATFRPPPLVSVITKIGLDHQGFLGNTIEEIAREKAGIIKLGVPVVFDGSNESSVAGIIESVASTNSAPVLPCHVRSLPAHTSETIRPVHSLQNYVVAKEAALAALEQLGISQGNLSELEFNQLLGIGSPTFAGRQEQIDVGPLLGRNTSRRALLDGAHNPQSAEALGDYLGRHFRQMDTASSQRPITWILAASDSKDMAGIIGPLLRKGDGVFAVEFGAVERMEWVKPMESAKIVALVQEAVPDLASTKDYGRDILGAIKAAATSEQDIVITGSLYLVGDVHRQLRSHAKKQRES